MKKKDIILILTVLIFGLFSWVICHIIPSAGDTVRITKNGRLYLERPLSADGEINIDGTNCVVIENGCAYMKSAACKDKLCMHMGKITDSSKKIICLPNKVIVEITKKSEIDTVVK